MTKTYSSAVWTVKAGEEDGFVKDWEGFVGWASELPGSGTFRLLRDLGRPNRFLSVGSWENSESARAWQQHPEFPERLGRPRGHCEDFQPAGYELVARVS